MISQLLMERETIDKEEFEALLGGRGPRRGLQGQGREPGPQGRREPSARNGNASPREEAGTRSPKAWDRVAAGRRSRR